VGSWCPRLASQMRQARSVPASRLMRTFLIRQEALQTATAVKLSRTLWIIPVAFVAGLRNRKAAVDPAKEEGSKLAIQWFIGLFLLASLASTFIPSSPGGTNPSDRGESGDDPHPPVDRHGSFPLLL